MRISLALILHVLDEIDNNFNYHAQASKKSSEEVYGIKRGQGGVGIFWNKRLKGVSIIETLKHDRICGIRMECTDGVVFVFLSVYLPASGSRESHSITIDELSSYVEGVDDNIIPIVGGDFNGDIGDQGGPRGIGRATKAGQNVLSFMKDHNLIAVNLMSKSTGSRRTYEGHNGSSTIDYVMIPEYLRDNVISCHTGNNYALNTSDHLSVEVNLALTLLPRCIELETQQQKLRWDKLHNNQMLGNYQRAVDNELWVIENRIRDAIEVTPDVIDNAFDSMVIAIHTAALIVPRSKFIKHLKPFWCNELTILKRDKMTWFKRWKEEGRSLDDNNFTRIRMKATKKAFCKRVKQLSKSYYNQMVAEAASKADLNLNDFWKFVRNIKGKKKSSFNAIKNRHNKVVYELDEVLEEWRVHFDNLSKPKNEPRFNQTNFRKVSQKINEWVSERDTSEFLELPFSDEEVKGAIGKLNCGKTPGHDQITSEHIKYAGIGLIRLICLLLNLCVQIEYIPRNFRKGVQVPLYKGKNTCPLSTDNYRGITLLSTFNKLFEAILWERIQPWWFDSQATSVLQGAARKGFSCVHTALTLQETISKQREGGQKVFVAYYDVSKAFDSVWTDGLFYQLYKIGIKGNLWRILYKSYENFQCCVRIGSKVSTTYTMDCGIHQGGYLSLIKYTAYVDSLISKLAESNLCCDIYRVKTSPVGYADDLAACTISKRRMDLVMDKVYQHGNDWRYAFNASKSAVLVFGENKKDRRIGAENRMFSLGGKRVKERLYYDHVGVKTCVDGDTHVRTAEKVIKARKALNFSTNLGIRKGGLNLETCNLIYWTFVVPTLLFGCESWVIKDKDVDLIRGFQRFAARRIQRLHYNSLNVTSFACLGWMDLITFIKARKIVFVRTILNMNENMPIRRVFIERLREYQVGCDNPYDSPVIQLLQYCSEFGLMGIVDQMAHGHVLSKVGWKNMVWKKAWSLEDREWTEVKLGNEKMDLIRRVTMKPIYSVWWALADRAQPYMRRCEIMVKLLCHASKLKADDCRFNRASFSNRCCTLCVHPSLENTIHMVMQCPSQDELREEMYNSIAELGRNLERVCTYDILMGKTIDGWSDDDMIPIRKITCTYITKMYYKVLNSRIV